MLVAVCLFLVFICSCVSRVAIFFFFYWFICLLLYLFTHLFLIYVSIYWLIVLRLYSFIYLSIDLLIIFLCIYLSSSSHVFVYLFIHFLVWLVLELVMLFRLINVWIYLMSRVRPASRPSNHSLCLANTFTLDITIRLFNSCFHTPNAYSHYWLLSVYTTFSDLHLALRSQGQHKENPLGFIFLGHFSTDQDEIWSGVEAAQVEMLMLLWRQNLTKREK